MSYQRPILASIHYAISILVVVATLAFAIFVVVSGRGAGRAEAIGVLLLMAYGLGGALIIAGVGQAYDLLGKIEFNTRILREEAEERAAAKHAGSGNQASSVRYITGIND